MDWGSLGSSVRGILQAKILEWIAFPTPGYLSDPGFEPGSPALQADSLPSEPPGKFPSCGYVELGVRDCHLFSTQGYNRPGKVGSHEERKAVSTFHPVSQRDRNQVVERMRMKKNHRENQRQGSVPAALRFLTLVLRDLLVFLPLISEICHCIISIPPFWLKLATIGSIATKES